MSYSENEPEKMEGHPVKRISFLAVVGGVAALFFSASAWAHHGDAGRYVDEPVEISGIVIAMQLVNPHAILVLEVTDADGKAVRWQAEMSSAQRLSRQGFANEVKIGTKVTLTGRPLKSGTPYMNLTNRARVMLTDSGKVVLQSSNYEAP